MYRISLAKALVSFVTLAALIAGALLLFLEASGSGGDPLKIEVFAKQYSWSFGYPTQGNGFANDEVHLPIDQPIEFEMHSEDVVHAFWIPEWSLKAGATPAQIETAEVTPEKTGTYQLICTEPCGIDHYAMHAKVVVEPSDRFQQWVNDLGAIPAHLRELANLDRELESIHESSGT